MDVTDKPGAVKNNKLTSYCGCGLRHWRWINGRACGVRCVPCGMGGTEVIITSPVVEISDPMKDGTISIRTRSGTVYHLSSPSALF